VLGSDLLGRGFRFGISGLQETSLQEIAVDTGNCG